MIKRTLMAFSFMVMIGMLLTSCGSSGGGSSTSNLGATLVSIAVTPSNPGIATGATQQFTAMGTYSDNTTPIITGAVTWSSSNTGVATISSTSGRATSIAAGSTVIAATSGSISGTTTLTITDPQLTAPTGVIAAATSGQVIISWNAVTGATSYNIYWSTTSGMTVANGTKITGATSPYHHNSLTNGTTYYYIVTAVNGAGESAPSIQTSAMPQVPAAVAPTGVAAMPSNTQNTITWSTVTGATSYNIYWSTTTGVTTANGTKITGATNPYTQTGLTNGIPYYYVVTAVNGNGESAASAQVSATPTPPGVITLASSLNSPANIAVDSTSIYWTENITNGSIKKIPIGGGTPITIASGLSQPFGIALDTTNVYWTEQGSGNVNKVGKNGGAVNNLATGLSNPSGIVVDSTTAYFSEDTSNGNIWKVALATGATPTILATDACGPKSIALDATSVYWGEYCFGGITIRKVNISDGTITTLYNDSPLAYNIAIDDTSIYWTDGTGTLRKVDKNGGTATNLVTGLTMPTGIYVDAANVYWTERYTVKQVAISGGNVTIIDSQNGGVSIVGDSGNLYWIDGSSIKTIAK